MKLISFRRNGAAGFGATDGRDVIDLTGRIGQAADLRGLLEIDGIERARAYCASAPADFSLSDCTLLPVVPNPSKVICLAINYKAHAIESGRDLPKQPVVFHRHAASLTAHNAPLIRPEVSDWLDWEGELAVVIGKGGGHIEPADALDHVAGYTCFNEASIRDWQRHSHLYGMGKNFRGTGAVGPWMVTADEIPDPAKLVLRTLLNGKEVQHAGLDDLIFGIPELISYVSRALDWQPGDLLVTGTPEGVGGAMKPPRWLAPGDIIEVDISHIGTLTNSVADEVS